MYSGWEVKKTENSEDQEEINLMIADKQQLEQYNIKKKKSNNQETQCDEFFIKPKKSRVNQQFVLKRANRFYSKVNQSQELQRKQMPQIIHKTENASSCKKLPSIEKYVVNRNNSNVQLDSCNNSYIKPPHKVYNQIKLLNETQNWIHQLNIIKEIQKTIEQKEQADKAKKQKISVVQIQLSSEELQSYRKKGVTLKQSLLKYYSRRQR